MSTADRLPDSFGHYVTFTENNEQGYNYYNDNTKAFRNESIIKYWLDERPDYEEEMHQMLLGIQDLDILPLEIEDELSLLLKKIRIQ